MKNLTDKINHLSVAAWVLTLQTLRAIVTRAHQLRSVPHNTVAARAVTMLEYAIIGAIAVIIGLIFRNQLSNFINNMWDRINTFFT